MKTRLAILIASFYPIGFATLVVKTPIPALYSTSTVVFVGRAIAATELSQTSESSGDEWTVDYTPLKIYKGNSGPLASIKIDFHNRERTWGTPASIGKTYLLFAVPGPDGKGLTLTNLFAGFAFSLDVAKAPDDATKSTPGGVESVETDILALALRANHDQMSWEKSMLQLLGEFPALSDTTINTLKQHAPFSDPESEFVRLAFLAKAEPEKYLSGIVASLSSMSSPTSDQIEFTFRILRTRNTQSNPEDLAMLESLANSPTDQVRFRAIYRMRELHDPRSIDFLLEKLENSSTDSISAYEALMGLAEITGRPDLATSMPEWDRGGEPYKAKWAAWAKSRSTGKQ